MTTRHIRDASHCSFSILVVTLVLVAPPARGALAESVTADATRTPTPTHSPLMVGCPGDCREIGQVQITDILTGVNIALGTTPVQACPAFDRDQNGAVTVDELLLGVSAALNGCANGPVGWRIQTVGPATSIESHLSLALDSAGRPAIAHFLNDQNLELRFIQWDGSQWQGENVTTYGEWPSLAFDSQNVAHVSFFHGSSATLRYGTRHPNGWEITIVDDQGPTGNAGTWNSLALDANDRPRISYLLKFLAGNIFTYELRYAEFDGAAWVLSDAVSREVCAPNTCGWNSSLALDSAGQPRITYVQNPPDSLNYVERIDGKWQPPTFVDLGGRPSSLRLDSQGRPLIGYHGHSGLPDPKVKFAYRDATGWKIETVDNQGVGGSGGIAAVSMVLDTKDTPHIAYIDYTTQTLKYASRMQDGTWHITNVDIGQSFDSLCSLQLDRQGVAHIAYIDLGQQILKYAEGPGLQ